ncbi:MAG: DUF533 domain-containing protein [Hyphomicrobium sp.]|nr:DUF533 domain-containing protein [Hyphomicrobium sp.]
MFDAKSILESLVRGAAPQNQAPQGGGGGLGDILGQILGGGQQGQAGGGGGGGLGDILGQIGKMTNPGGGAPAQRGARTDAGQDSQGGGGLADILAEVQRQLGQGGQQGGQQGGGAHAPQTRQASEAPSAGDGGLGDILGQLKGALGQAGGSGAAGGGGIADILGQILGQATAGAKEGATRIGEATGAKDALGRVTGGQSPEELLEKLKGLVRDNPMAATGAAGGLGGLVLGTKTGRAMAGSAARIGALALIGGLAYKAFQNYQAGRPLITGAMPAEAAPQGSGFEPAAVTNESAALYIRAMIAAAAADGRIDPAEQAKILGGLKQAGVDAEAEEFLANELNNPASVEDLAGAVTSPEEAVQLYTAARMAIEPDTRGEQAYLASLAAALGVDNKLAAHIDATTRSAAA